MVWINTQKMVERNNRTPQERITIPDSHDVPEHLRGRTVVMVDGKPFIEPTPEEARALLRVLNTADVQSNRNSEASIEVTPWRHEAQVVGSFYFGKQGPYADFTVIGEQGETESFFGNDSVVGTAGKWLQRFSRSESQIAVILHRPQHGGSVELLTLKHENRSDNAGRQMAGAHGIVVADTMNPLELMLVTLQDPQFSQLQLPAVGTTLRSTDRIQERASATPDQRRMNAIEATLAFGESIFLGTEMLPLAVANRSLVNCVDYMGLIPRFENETNMLIEEGKVGIFGVDQDALHRNSRECQDFRSLVVHKFKNSNAHLSILLREVKDHALRREIVESYCNNRTNAPCLRTPGAKKWLAAIAA